MSYQRVYVVQVCSAVTENAGDDREFVHVVNIGTGLDHQMLQPMKHKKA